MCRKPVAVLLCISILLLPTQRLRAEPEVEAQSVDLSKLPSGTGAPIPPQVETPVPSQIEAPASPSVPPIGLVSSSAPVLKTPKPIDMYRRPRKGLLAGGVVLFLLGYGADIGVTYGYHHAPASTSLIPLVGPFLQLAEKYGLDGPPVDTGSLDADARITRTIDTGNRAIRALALTGAAVAGIAQVTGLVLTIVGAVTKRKITRYAASENGMILKF